MKTLTTTFILAIIFSINLFANNELGTEKTVVIKNERVELSTTLELVSELKAVSNFDAIHDHIEIEFDYTISMIQVFNNDGEVEMMFPVESKKVVLGLSLFEQGQYKLGFLVEGFEDVQYSDLKIN